MHLIDTCELHQQRGIFDSVSSTGQNPTFPSAEKSLRKTNIEKRQSYTSITDASKLTRTWEMKPIHGEHTTSAMKSETRHESKRIEAEKTVLCCAEYS